MLPLFVKVIESFILMQNKVIEKGLNREGVCKNFGVLFSKKVPFLANIECRPKFLEYPLRIKACICIVVPQQKWIVLLKIKVIEKNEDAYSYKLKIKPGSWYSFSFKEPLMALVIARAVLHYQCSVLFHLFRIFWLILNISST